MITIKSNDKVSDVYQLLKTAILQTNRTLLQADTGSGKTHFSDILLRDLYSQNEGVYVIAVDTVDLANQVSKKYDITCITGNTDVKIKKSAKKGVYVTTYDSLINFKKIDYLIIDEAHQLVSASTYRKKAMEVLQKYIDSATPILFITATPYYLFNLKKTCNHIVVQTPTKLNYNYKIVRLNKKNIVASVMCIINNNPILKDNKIVVYINNTTYLQTLFLYLKQTTKYNVVLIDSYAKEVSTTNPYTSVDLNNILENDYANLGLNKPLNLLADTNKKANNDCLNSIMNTELIPNNVDIVLCTSVLQNGININNDNIQYIITSELDNVDLTQFKARFRKGVLNDVYLIHENVLNMPATLHDEIEFDRLKKVWLSEINKQNKFILSSNNNILQKDKLKIIAKQNQHIMKENDKGLYELSEFGVCSEVYKMNRLAIKTNLFFFQNFTEYKIDTTSITNLKNVYEKINAIKKAGFEKYIEDENILHYNRILKMKRSNNRAYTKDKFYCENQLLFLNKKVQRTNLKFLNLSNFFDTVRTSRSFEVLKKLTLDNHSLYFHQKSLVFNYLEDRKITDLETAKYIFNLLSKKEVELLKIMKDVKYSLVNYINSQPFKDLINTDIDVFSQLKIFIFQNLSAKNKGILKYKNDSLFKELLESIFCITKKRIRIKNHDNKIVQKTVYNFDVYKLDADFKNLYTNIDTLKFY